MVPGMRKLKHSFSTLFSSSSVPKSDDSVTHPSPLAVADPGDAPQQQPQPTPPPPPPQHRGSDSNADRSSFSSSASSRLSRSSSSLSRLSRALSIRSSKKTCTICLGDLKIGQGRAIFVAECSHSFHFNCIASNVKHGSQVCPICRSKWKEIPSQAPAPTNVPAPHHHQNRGRARAPPSVPSPPTLLPSFSMREPTRFSDDEPLSVPAASAADHTSSAPSVVAVKCFTEYPVVSAFEAHPEFAVLASIRAPVLLQRDHAPIDLVTVLDISGSMAGSKLSLLKHAVHFIIQNLGSSDRLSIVVFSSTAHRILPLRRMNESGRAEAALTISSLLTDGGTNILNGLKKGLRVLEERQERNPVSSIILLSDGKSQPSVTQPLTLPQLPRTNAIPVHSFGFGTDHDSTALYSISDSSGGTFSFIESVGMVGNAFARCIGGLLSVVAQELQLTVKTLTPGVQITSIRSGRYNNEICDEGRRSVIDIGNMYAEEEKGFLLYLSIPAAPTNEGGEMETKTPLLDITCQYKTLGASEEDLVMVEGERVEIQISSEASPQMTVSLEVDRHRNRVLVAEGIAEAQRLAERGDLQGAKALLEAKRAILLASASATAGDAICTWLDAELRETKERMESRELYEHTGRAYVLSGLSSHSWQRSTTRGDSITQTFVCGDPAAVPASGPIGYETPSMVSMVRMSQNLSITGPWPSPRA
ncbi:E3 ubiquitin-protein ligase WAV3-like [Senna tora]|uniref:E3 ubiquitin-protein ligase WAV3-like n=1 Tax=Senna tora TaxID=362788 RepID=A0A834XC84_9FABA|nr:E3 ubiquitin-protein ligase WAV3-like [Senna tora]